jgi:hypothetical protein
VSIDTHLGISGEDFCGSHPATDFVAGHNRHPDHLMRSESRTRRSSRRHHPSASVPSTRAVGARARRGAAHVP